MPSNDFTREELLAERARRKLGRDVSIGELYREATIRGLGGFVGIGGAMESESLRPFIGDIEEPRPTQDILTEPQENIRQRPREATIGEPPPGGLSLFKVNEDSPGFLQAIKNAFEEADRERGEGPPTWLEELFRARIALNKFIEKDEAPLQFAGGLGGFADELIGQASLGTIPSESSLGREVEGSGGLGRFLGQGAGFLLGAGPIASGATKGIGNTLLRSVARGGIEGAIIADPGEQVSQVIRGEQDVGDAVKNIGVGVTVGAVLDPALTRGVPATFNAARSAVRKLDQLADGLAKRTSSTADVTFRTDPTLQRYSIAGSLEPAEETFFRNTFGITGGGLAYSASERQTDEFGNLGYAPDPSGTGLAVGIGIGLLASRGRGTTLQSVFRLSRDAMVQAQKQFKSTPGKTFTRMARRNYEISHETFGRYGERFGQTGVSLGGKFVGKVKNLTDEQAEALAAELEAGTQPQLKRVLTDFYNEAKKHGVDVAGFQNNYFPRQLTQDSREVLFNDLNKVAGDIPSSMADKFGSEAEASAHLKAILDGNDLSETTKKAVRHLLDTKQAENVFEAFVDLQKYVTAQTFTPAGNLQRDIGLNLFRKAGFLEKSRGELELPKDLYDRNAKRVLANYFRSGSERIADARVWGAGEKTYKNLRNRIAKESLEEANNADMVLRMMRGQLDQTPVEGSMQAHWQRIGSVITSFEVSTKIAAGFGTLLNVTQSGISTFRDAGWMRGARGVARLLSERTRANVRSSGSTADLAIEQLIGYQPNSRLGKVADFLTRASGFKGINRANQYIGAATGEVFVRDLHKLANGTGVRREWARERLKDFGINYRGKLSDERVRRAMYRFATDTQLQRNVLADPFLFNRPGARPFVLFKRFGYRQWVYTKDEMTKELSRGNALPLLRLAAAGYAGGEFIGFGKNQIANLLSGRTDRYRKTPPYTLKRLAENMATVGTMGFVGDLVAADDFNDIWNNINFFLIPVAISDLEKLGVSPSRNEGLAQQAFKDIERGLPAKDVARRAVIKFSRVLGSFPAAAAKLLETEREIQKRTDYYWGVERQELLDLLSEGKMEDALYRITLWNEAFPEKPIEYDDIDVDEVIKRMQRRAESAIP